MQDFAVARTGASVGFVELAACNCRKWFIPKPNSPIAPAWMAVRRETSGCRKLAESLTLI